MDFVSVMARTLGAQAPVRWGIATAGAALAFLFPDPAERTAAALAVSLIGADTATGVVAAHQNGIRIQSRRFARVLTKSLGYASTLLVAAASGQCLSEDSKHVAVSGILSLIAATEGLSVIENLRAIGVPIPPGVERWLREGAKRD